MSIENLQNKLIGIDGVYWWRWGEMGEVDLIFVY